MGKALFMAEKTVGYCQSSVAQTKVKSDLYLLSLEKSLYTKVLFPLSFNHLFVCG